ncbi:MAG: dynamin family protein [Cardiobacteriaceae bacterium]|nr:dynamin family protein [Cardiobacteriaceae bacterium]
MQSPNHLPSEILLAYRDELINRLLDQIELIDDIQNSELMTQGSESANDSNKLLTHANLEESKAILKGEIAKLEHFDVVLSVVGTMKAGKSTTINAIVGQEILPSRNRPMTTLPTLIRHTPGQNHPELTFDSTAINSFAQNIQTLLRNHPECKSNPEISANPSLQKLLHTIETAENTEIFQNDYHGEAEIFAFLESLNDIVRLSEMLGRSAIDNDIPPDHFAFPYAQYRNFDSLPLITVAFSNLKDHEHLPGRLTLLDTPGPNESGQNHLQAMLDAQLRRSSAVLLILDYTQLKSNAEADVRAQLEQLPHIDKKRLFALANKFDQYKSNSDDAEQTRDMIYGDLLKDKIFHENIFAISAQKASLAQRMAAEIDRTGNKPGYQCNSWIADFAHSIYPDYDKEEVTEEWESTDLANILKSIERMKKSSRISLPVEKIILQTRVEAPVISAQSALLQVKASLDNIHNALAIHNKAAASSREELDKLKALVANLKEKTNRLHSLEKYIKDDLQEIVKKEKAFVDTGIRKLQTETEQLVHNAFDQMIKELEGLLDDATITRKEFFFKFDAKRLFSFKGRKIISDAQKKAKKDDIKERLGKKKITIKGDNEKDLFLKRINEIYQLSINKNNNIAKNITTESFHKVRKNFNHAEQEIQQIFHFIQQEFSKNNIDIKMEPLSHYCIESISEDSVQYSREMMREEKTERVASGGFWAWCQRKLHLGGYEDKEIPIYTDTLREIEEHIINDISHNIYLPTKDKVEIFVTHLTEQVMQSISTFKSGIEVLNNEFVEAIALNESQITDKEKFCTVVRNLRRRSAILNGDIEAIRKVFALQETRA